jgi:hypothetical protein
LPDQPENPLDPSPEHEQKVRERAYHLWEADGRPHGRDAEYWERARELQAIADSTGAAELPNPMTEHRIPSAEQPIEEAEIQENLGEFPLGGLTDQGDRVETPMTRRKARNTPTMGEHDVQDRATVPETPKPAEAPAAKSPAAAAAKPIAASAAKPAPAPAAKRAAAPPPPPPPAPAKRPAPPRKKG